MHGQTLFVLVLDCTSVSIFNYPYWITCVLVKALITPLLSGFVAAEWTWWLMLEKQDRMWMLLFCYLQMPDWRLIYLLTHVPPANMYIVAANTPMSDHSEWQELANSCEGLKFSKRITSRQLRTYIATVSQVCYKFVTVFVVRLLFCIAVN